MDDLGFLGKLFPHVPLSSIWVGWNDGVGGFPGGPADEYLDRLPGGAGHYFCIGALKKGHTQRRKTDIEEVLALVLDDIGSKAKDAAGIVATLGQPSWIIETSHGNFQYGWVYRRPVKDFAAHEALVGECVRRWGVDKAGADRNRAVRLPSGVNLKEGRGRWGVRLVGGYPAYAISFEETFILLGSPPAVASGAGVDLAELGRTGLWDAGTDVWVNALVELGMAKHDNPNGTLEIECPWVAEHTDRREGTAYLGNAHFRCQHDHCSGRKSPGFKREIEARLVANGKSLVGLLRGMAFPEDVAAEEAYVGRKAISHMFDPPRWPPGGGGGAGSKDRLTIRTEAEAVDRLVYVTGQRQFYDEESKTLLSHDQIDEALYPVQEPGKRGQKAMHNVLLARSDLRGVEHLTYRPGLAKIVNDDLERNLAAFNVWKGSTLVRAPAGKRLRVILRHVDRLFPDPDYAKAIVNWMAALVQRPEVKIEWMPIVVGVGGTGKDLLFGMLRELLGPTNMVKLGTERLLDEDSRIKAFTGHQVVILEELSMTLVKGKDVATLLKPLITEDRVFGRGIYEGSVTKPNTASVLAYSNTENALNISPDSDDQRRYLPYISPARALAKAEADELVEATELGAGELLGFLLDRDLVANGWDAHRKPDIGVSRDAAATMAGAGARGPAKEVVDLLDGPGFCDRTLIMSSEITEALRARRVGNSALHALGDGMANAGFVRWKDARNPVRSRGPVTGLGQKGFGRGRLDRGSDAGCGAGGTGRAHCQHVRERKGCDDEEARKRGLKKCPPPPGPAELKVVFVTYQPSTAPPWVAPGSPPNITLFPLLISILSTRSTQIA